MANIMPFGKVLETIDQMLTEVLHHRITERRREELAQDMRDAQEEFAAGHCRPTTPEELANEILS